jgi:hypothetical protein
MRGKLMTAKKTKVGTARGAKPNRNGKHANYVESIRRRLSKVPGVDAVYVWRSSNHIVHVTSVVVEIREALFDKLIPQEDLVEEDHPRIAFDFHVRARQNRSVDSAIPPGSLLIFKKP